MAADEGFSAGSGKRKRVLLGALLAACACVFLALGLWQIARRSQKLELIAAVEHRLQSTPVAAPGPSAWPRISFGDDAYLRVRVAGIYRHDRETLVLASTERGPGYWVITPLDTASGWTVLVNRGFVPPEDRDRSARKAGEPRGPVSVEGLLRISEPGGGFLRSNDAGRDRWYSRDVAAIGRARRLEHLAPYFIDSRGAPDSGRQPVGGLTIVSFPNPHLQYALTWLALAALAVFGLLRLRRDRGGVT